MTPFYLQQDLKIELERLFANFNLKSPDGEYKKINVFEQNLPISNDEEDDPYPYIIVKITKGEIKDLYSNNTVQLMLIIGTYDDSNEANGHKDVFNIIQKIFERFRENPNLSNKYVIQDSFEFALSEEDTWPYYFGGIEIGFDIHTIEREDKFSWVQKRVLLLQQRQIKL